MNDAGEKAALRSLGLRSLLTKDSFWNTPRVRSYMIRNAMSAKDIALDPADQYWSEMLNRNRHMRN